MSNKARHPALPVGATKDIGIRADALSGDPPGHEEIAALAYSYWEARGYQGGSQEQDWLRAEEELRKRHAPLRMPKAAHASAKGAGV